jgi:hypothetical protein
VGELLVDGQVQLAGLHSGPGYSRLMTPGSDENFRTDFGKADLFVPLVVLEVVGKEHAAFDRSR